VSVPALDLELEPSTLSVTPGKGTGCDLRIHNPGSQPCDVHVELLGPGGDWSLATPEHLTVPGGGEAKARLIFRPPRSPGLVPGPVPFTLRVTSANNLAPVTEADGVVEVGGYAELDVRLAPRTAGGRHTARYRLEVDNRGNEVSLVTVEAASESDGLTVEVSPATDTLAPGSAATVALTARSHRAHVGWRPRSRRFTVAVRAEGTSTTRFDATMAQEPVPWALPLAVVALVAGLGGLVLALSGDTPSPGAGGVEVAASEAPAIPSPVYAVGSRIETFVDESRPTRAHASLAAEPARTLRTLILYPATGAAGGAVVEGATAATGDGPFPLIVFAHGSGGLGAR
jgi:hypothetical protein